MFFDFVILVLCMLFRPGKNNCLNSYHCTMNIVFLLFHANRIVLFLEGHIFVWTGGLLHLLFRFISVSLLSKMCSDKTGGLNDGLPPALTPIFGKYISVCCVFSQ